MLRAILQLEDDGRNDQDQTTPVLGDLPLQYTPLRLVGNRRHDAGLTDGVSTQKRKLVPIYPLLPYDALRSPHIRNFKH